jgi:hypothetical protein
MVPELARNPPRKLTHPVLHPVPASPKNPAVQPAQVGPLLPKGDQISGHDILAEMTKRSLTRRMMIMELEAVVLDAPGRTRKGVEKTTTKEIMEKTTLPLALADPAPDIMPRKALNNPEETIVVEEEMMTEMMEKTALPPTLRDPLRDPVRDPVLIAVQALPVDPTAIPGNALERHVDENILTWENNSPTCLAQWESLQASPSKPRSRRTGINPSRIYWPL